MQERRRKVFSLNPNPAIKNDGQRGRALIIDIWLSGGAGTNLADGMGTPRLSLAPLKFSVLSAR